MIIATLSMNVMRSPHERDVKVLIREVLTLLSLLQEKYSINQRYLEGGDLSGRMRAILVDWLVQVHLRFHLLQETLYLTIAIIDRFLQVRLMSGFCLDVAFSTLTKLKVERLLYSGKLPPYKLQLSSHTLLYIL